MNLPPFSGVFNGVSGGGFSALLGRIWRDARGVSFRRRLSDGNLSTPERPNVYEGRYLNQNDSGAAPVDEPGSRGTVSPGLSEFGPDPAPSAVTHTRLRLRDSAPAHVG